MINRIGWHKRQQQQKNVLMKHLAPSFLEVINVVWIKCLLPSLKETYIAGKYGFMFCRCADLPGLSPQEERPLSPGTARCRPRAPSRGWLRGGEPRSPRGSERRRCGGTEWQDRRRKMKTHKRSISELEMEALAHRAVPRKARQLEIDVLLPNERAKNGNSL